MNTIGYNVFAMFDGIRVYLSEVDNVDDLSKLIMSDQNDRISVFNEDEEIEMLVYKKELSDFEVYQYQKGD